MKWVRIAGAANALFYALFGRCLVHDWTEDDGKRCAMCKHERPEK